MSEKKQRSANLVPLSIYTLDLMVLDLFLSYYASSSFSLSPKIRATVAVYSARYCGLAALPSPNSISLVCILV